jgi:nitrogen fixation NifU-like protein
MMRYSDTLHQYFSHPCRVGMLPVGTPGRGAARVGEARHGGVIDLSIQIDAATDSVLDAGFRAYGCGATIAAASWVCAWLPGHTTSQVSELRDSLISQALKLPSAKLHCAVLAVSAAHAALADYQASRLVNKS